MTQAGPRDFNAYTQQFNGTADRIITSVRLVRAFDPATPPDPPYPEFETTALWDTGATKSGITRATADALQLVPTGTVMVNHARGCDQANTYVVNFILPNRVGIVGVLVTEMVVTAGNFGALIGMDIICAGDFAITNCEGKTCMSYRYPAIARIDYVDEANKVKRARYAHVGRNDPCPCGKKDASGKPMKYKNCCMKALGA